MSAAAMTEALPPAAREALLLARELDKECDEAAAWLALTDFPIAKPEFLARYMRAQARRERRQGGAHGPARFIHAEEQQELGHGWSDDPADLIEAFQEVASRAGLEQALAELEPTLSSAAMAKKCRITRRRAQQLLAERAALEGRQGVLL
jgi:hypothetical protein